MSWLGTPPMTQADVAAALAEALGRPVAGRPELVDTWERRARAGGLGKAQISTLREMFAYYARYGLPGNPKVLGWLLGRPPTPLRRFCRPCGYGQGLMSSHVGVGAGASGCRLADT